MISMNKLSGGILVFMLAGAVYLANELSAQLQSGLSASQNETRMLLFIAMVLIGLISILYFGREVYRKIKAAEA